MTPCHLTQPHGRQRVQQRYVRASTGTLTCSVVLPPLPREAPRQYHHSVRVLERQPLSRIPHARPCTAGLPLPPREVLQLWRSPSLGGVRILHKRLLAFVLINSYFLSLPLEPSPRANPSNRLYQLGLPVRLYSFPWAYHSPLALTKNPLMFTDRFLASTVSRGVR